MTNTIVVDKMVLQRNGFQDFNEVQKNCLDKLEKSLVVSAPTASGKTIIAELFILEQVLNENKKVIYTCPLRALASEHYKDFKRKYPEITFALSTGDLDSSSSYLKKFDVIFTTYEKAQSLLRHKAEWLPRVGCLIVDEIHELDSDRGPVLEIALTQMMNANSDLKVLGLSATIPNAKELAEWLKAELVESDFRPVKLKEGVLCNNSVEYNDGSKEEGTLEKIIEKTLAENKQLLVFANTRKRAEGIAKKLSEITKKFSEEKDFKDFNGIKTLNPFK
jgi:helicase